MDHIQAGHLGQQRDRLEVIVGVKRQLVKNKRIDRKGANVTQNERVTVGALRTFGHGNVAAGAGLVFNKHRLAQAFADLVGRRPRHNFRAAARGKRHQQADGFAGPRSLGEGRNNRRKSAGSGQHGDGFQGCASGDRF